jgi:ppGpp synthetase/RelA/SpoT-type nucleotidyltranferase
MVNKEEIKKSFVRKYSQIHSELDILEKEIDNNIKNKKDLVCDSYKIDSLKKRTHELVELLNKTREDERRIFNY